MKKLIEICKGDMVPDNAVFVSTRVAKEYSHTKYDYGIFFTDRYDYFKITTYYVYEIPVESEE